MRLLAIVVHLLLVANWGYAQPVPVDTLPPPDTLKIPKTVTVPDTSLKADTILYVPADDTSALAQLTSPTDLEHHLSQKPTVALFKSMFVPGWGQIGNKKYMKAGMFIGLQTWFISSAIHYGRQAGDFKDEYNAATDLDARNALYGQYRDRRSERNKYLWFFGITTFISMFDAYVDAHLSGSPTEPRNRAVSLDVGPDFRGGAQVKLALSIP